MDWGKHRAVYLNKTCLKWKEINYWKNRGRNIKEFNRKPISGFWNTGGEKKVGVYIELTLDEDYFDEYTLSLFEIWNVENGIVYKNISKNWAYNRKRN